MVRTVQKHRMVDKYTLFICYCRPPRFMGDGFVVLHSNNADIYYYHDEPGESTGLVAFLHHEERTGLGGKSKKE